MTMSLRVTGYEKRSERLVVTHPIPSELLADVRSLVHVDDDDDGLGAYPLDCDAIAGLTLRLHCPLDPEIYDWFLEPV